MYMQIQIAFASLTVAVFFKEVLNLKVKPFSCVFCSTFWLNLGFTMVYSKYLTIEQFIFNLLVSFGVTIFISGYLGYRYVR